MVLDYRGNQRKKRFDASFIWCARSNMQFWGVYKDFAQLNDKAGDILYFCYCQ